MKPLFRLFAAAGLFVAVHAFAADAFEGKVSLAITADKGRTQVLNYSMKGQMLRTDLTAEKREVTTIMDMNKLEMLMLIPEQNMYMTMPIKKPVEKAMTKQGESTAELEVTGKTETILGHKCDQILVKDKGTVTELWVASDLGTFMGMGSGGGPGGGGGNPMAGMFGGRSGAGGGGGPKSAKWEEALKGKGGFPLRVISRDAAGKESFKMEATKIEPGSLPDSLFQPPAGYEKFQMPDLGGMFKPGGR